jgi:uncharacterized protein YcbK (DUF882 family)
VVLGDRVLKSFGDAVYQKRTTTQIQKETMEMSFFLGRTFMERKRIAPNFYEDEFMCSCCGEVKISRLLLEKLQILRNFIGHPMELNSAYRCEKHNAKVGGKKNSFHISGEAVDVACSNSFDRLTLVREAIKVGFKGIGISSTFVHLDVRSGVPVMFLYATDE